MALCFLCRGFITGGTALSGLAFPLPPPSTATPYLRGGDWITLLLLSYFVRQRHILLRVGGNGTPSVLFRQILRRSFRPAYRTFGLTFIFSLGNVAMHRNCALSGTARARHSSGGRTSAPPGAPACGGRSRDGSPLAWLRAQWARIGKVSISFLYQ